MEETGILKISQIGVVMEYINTEEFQLQNTCVTLGKFDGIHLGHRLLLQHLAKEKENNGQKSVVFTFDFHPGMFFSDGGGQLIYTEEEKKAILRDAGIDVLIAYPFTKETSAMEAEDFIEEIFVKKLGAKMIVVGKDNRFGHNRRGNVEMLEAFSKQYGFRALSCEKVKDEADVISSTLIRKELENGNLERVNRMLGGPYHICGSLEQGSRIGLPTVRLLPPKEKLLPPKGAYAVKVVMENGTFYGVAYIGSGTLADQPGASLREKVWVEAFLPDYHGECHGKHAKIEIYHFMHPECRFESAEELCRQMVRDKEEYRKYL